MEMILAILATFSLITLTIWFIVWWILTASDRKAQDEWSKELEEKSKE